MNAIKPPVSGHHFGRRVAVDTRDTLFRAQLRKRPTRRFRYWNLAPATDQGPTPRCVAFSWLNVLRAGPVKNTKNLPNGQTLYDLAQTADEWTGNCVDTETLCLSDRGWLRGDQLQVGDRILTFDISTETTRWAPVQKVHRHQNRPYRIWSSRAFAAAVTDNHRWAVRLRPNGSDNATRPYRMTTTAEWKQGDEIPRSAKCDSLSAQSGVSDDFVELVAWVATEGYYRPDTRRGNGIVVSQKVEKDRVTELMDRLGVAAGHEKPDGCHCWELSGDLAARVRSVAPDRAPSMRFLAALTQQQLELFMEVFVLADGNETPAQGNRQSRISISQKTGPILDSVLAAATLAGMSLGRASKGGGSGGDVETWTIRRSNRIEPRRLEPSPYIVGDVWCPETEVGTFIARRGASVFITGNSYDGTSVRAGAKVLTDLGYIGEYRWSWSAREVLDWILLNGPVVFGTVWPDSMMSPGKDGWLTVEKGPAIGPHASGHAYAIVGGSQVKKRRGVSAGALLVQNSWGEWPHGNKRGTAWLALDDAQALLDAAGEACLPTEFLK